MRGTETDEESASSGCGEVKLEFPGRQLTDRQTEAFLVELWEFTDDTQGNTEQAKRLSLSYERLATSFKGHFVHFSPVCSTQASFSSQMYLIERLQP